MTHAQIGTFADLGIGKNFLEILTKKGFTTPTPIQHQVIPSAIEGTDVIGIAQTGTGKTLAFSIPMIQQLGLKKGKGLIIVPTRELAEQVESEIQNISAPLGMRTAVLIGGAKEYQQIKAMKNNPHLIIATPGRLFDFVERKIVDLKEITMVTLDEADRMLDMGFLPSIKKVMKAVPADRQTMLFSATMPKSIAELAQDFMKSPLHIEIAPQGTSAKNVEQGIYMVQNGDKMKLLYHVLEQYNEDSVLVFCRTKHGAKRMVQTLKKKGYSAVEIHGNRTQAQRKKALEGFTKKRYRMLIATDVAARGIDVDHLSLVINYDLPDTLDDYVHRIGRTGRAGRFGRAISFVAPNQRREVKGIERIIKKDLPQMALPTNLQDVPDAPKSFYDDEPFEKKRGGSFRGGRSQRSRTARGPRDAKKGQWSKRAPKEKTEERFSKPKREYREDDGPKKNTRSFSKGPKRGRDQKGSWSTSDRKEKRDDWGSDSKREYRGKSGFKKGGRPFSKGPRGDKNQKGTWQEKSFRDNKEHRGSDSQSEGRDDRGSRRKSSSFSYAKGPQKARGPRKNSFSFSKGPRTQRSRSHSGRNSRSSR